MSAAIAVKNMSEMKICCRSSKNGYEGTVTVPGLKPTKLVKKNGETVYATKSAVTAAAKSVAERFGMTLGTETTEKVVA